MHWFYLVFCQKSFTAEACLFEYDQRFQRYGSDFTFYDYNFPENLPEKHQHAFQVVVADPPYLVSSFATTKLVFCISCLLPYFKLKETTQGLYCVYACAHNTVKNVSCKLQSKECIEKTAKTMKLMAKDGRSCFLLLTGRCLLWGEEGGLWFL